MRRLLLILLLLLGLAAHSEPVPGKVTAEFVNADLVFVLKVIAKQMGRNIYIGPTVQGAVDAKFKDVEAESALKQVLGEYPDYEYKLLDAPVRPSILVAARGKLEELADGY